MPFQTRHDLMPEGVFFAKQVHGTRAVRVTRENTLLQIALEEADALWTTEPSIAVGVKTADCGPVLLRHRAGVCVAAIHAGWKGAVAGIVPKTLLGICRELNLEASDFEAKIGPCIGFNAYEIGPEVAVQIPGAFLKPGRGDRSYFDLRGLIASQLKNLGVSKIEVSMHCTFSEPETYFSHRRQEAGRQYSWLTAV